MTEAAPTEMSRASRQGAWPPDRLFQKTQDEINHFATRAARHGFGSEELRWVWEEGMKLHLRRTEIPPLRRSKKPPLAGRLIEKARGLLRSFVFTSIPAFSASQHTIALEGFELGRVRHGDSKGEPKPKKTAPKSDRFPDAPGVRQARDLLKMLRRANLLRVIERLEEKDRYPGEPRSTIYILNLPEEALEAVALERARRERQSELRLPNAPPAAACDVPNASEPAPTAPKMPRPPSPARAVPSWWLPIAQELRRAHYPDPNGDTGNNIREQPRIFAIENALEQAAADCRNECTKRGLLDEQLPDVAAAREDLARSTLTAWLQEEGAQGRLMTARHPLAWFWTDVARLLKVAVRQWLREYLRAHPPPAPAPSVVPEAVRPATGPVPVGAVLSALAAHGKQLEDEEARAAAAELRARLAPGGGIRPAAGHSTQNLAVVPRPSSRARVPALHEPGAIDESDDKPP